MEGLLEVVGLELTMESIMTGAHSKSRRERVPNFRSCNAETAGATAVSPAKMAEPVEMPFAWQTFVDPRNRVLNEVHIGASL